MATLAEPPDCRDSNPESLRNRSGHGSTWFLIVVKVDEANAGPLSVLLNWASDIDEKNLVV
jgi:hypothetical protein